MISFDDDGSKKKKLPFPVLLPNKVLVIHSYKSLLIRVRVGRGKGGGGAGQSISNLCVR